MDKLSFLFEELAKKQFNFTDAKVKKYRNWVATANEVRAKDLLDSKLNQYDKAEELITFYTFAPIELRKDKNDVVEEILKLGEIHETIEKLEKISFEKLYKSPNAFLNWLNKKVVSNPIRYVRMKGRQNVAKGKPLEGKTHVDVVIETKRLVVLVEVKFTSDISYQIDYYPIRNQLARNIDVGIEEAKKKGKRLVVLLCTPEELFNKKSRFYYYKIKDYKDPNKIFEDLEWRPIEEIKEHLLKVAWIPLEKVIEIVYQNLNSSEIEKAKEFFKERNLLY
jgi:hypothetical protein